MASRVQLLTKKNLAHPPKWLPDNIHYEVIMGSVAYGVSSDTSDMDVYGSLDNAVKREVPVEKMIAELKAVIEKYS